MAGCFGRVGCATLATGTICGAALAIAARPLRRTLSGVSGAAEAIEAAPTLNGRARAMTMERLIFRSMQGPPVGSTACACTPPVSQGPHGTEAAHPSRPPGAHRAPSLSGPPGSQPEVADHASAADSLVNTFSGVG